MGSRCEVIVNEHSQVSNSVDRTHKCASDGDVDVGNFTGALCLYNIIHYCCAIKWLKGINVESTVYRYRSAIYLALE